MIRAGSMRGLVAVALALVVAGCMLIPGRFTSSLDIRRDGQFTFAYTGEINILALGKLAQMDGGNSRFTPTTCQDDAGKDRTCTAAELAGQKSAWEESRRQSAERRKGEAEKMKPLLGGLDYSDPRAAEELAARLRKQAGWNRVVYRGDGLYDVDFRLSGRLDHDFQFPTMERFPNFGGFVTVSVRTDGTVRVDAPGFGPAAGGDTWRSMMGMAAMGEGKPEVGMPVPDGTFVLTTDGEVLANNTDDAPQADPAGKRLTWPVNLRTTAAPMAIVRR
jgi:hypothetical protein